MTYAQKLKDPRWQRKRLEIMNRDNFQCQKCGSEDITLAVHHKEYIYGNSPWDYPGHLLITLCENCHQSEHSIESVAAKEDAPFNLEDWILLPPFNARRKDIIPAMKIRGVYEAHASALSKIRKEISERNKPVQNG